MHRLIASLSDRTKKALQHKHSKPNTHQKKSERAGSDDRNSNNGTDSETEIRPSEYINLPGLYKHSNSVTHPHSDVDTDSSEVCNEHERNSSLLHSPSKAVRSAIINVASTVLKSEDINSENSQKGRTVMDFRDAVFKRSLTSEVSVRAIQQSDEAASLVSHQVPYLSKENLAVVGDNSKSSNDSTVEKSAKSGLIAEGIFSDPENVGDACNVAINSPSVTEKVKTDAMATTSDTSSAIESGENSPVCENRGNQDVAIVESLATDIVMKCDQSPVITSNSLTDIDNVANNAKPAVPLNSLLSSDNLNTEAFEFECHPDRSTGSRLEQEKLEALEPSNDTDGLLQESSVARVSEDIADNVIVMAPADSTANDLPVDIPEDVKSSAVVHETRVPLADRYNAEPVADQPLKLCDVDVSVHGHAPAAETSETITLPLESFPDPEQRKQTDAAFEHHNVQSVSLAGDATSDIPSIVSSSASELKPETPATDHIPLKLPWRTNVELQVTDAPTSARLPWAPAPA